MSSRAWNNESRRDKNNLLRFRGQCGFRFHIVKLEFLSKKYIRDPLHSQTVSIKDPERVRVLLGGSEAAE